MTVTTTPSGALEYTLSRDASLVVETVDTEIRIRGTDGDIARIRLTDGDLASEFRVEASPDRLEIRPIRRWAIGWRRRVGPLEIEAPRTVRVDARSASASILALDVTGGANVRTASGDVELAGAGGSISVDAVSGAIRVHAPAVVGLVLTSVSGRIEVAAGTIGSLKARSMSAAIRVIGRLAGNGPFTLESVSGDLTLGTDGAVRLMASTVSGEVRSELAGMTESSGGRRTIALGGGGPAVSARTVSGGIRLVPWDGDPRTGEASQTVAFETTARPEGAPDEGQTTGAAPTTGDAAEPATIGEADLPTATGEAAERADAAATSATATDGSPTEADPRLPILRALERGEIGVEEAGRLIDAAEADATVSVPTAMTEGGDR